MTPIGLAPPPNEPELHDSAQAELAAEGRSVVPHPSRRALPQRFFGVPLWISVGAHALVLLGLLLYVNFGPEATPRRAALQTVQYVDLVLPSEVEPAAVAPPTEAAGPAQPDASTEATPTPPGTSTPAAGAPPVITSQGGESVVPEGNPDATGAGSVAERLRPGFSDPRLYADPQAARLREPGLSDAERYRQHFQARIDALNDSMYGGSGPNTDWTTEDGSGRRWGISEEGIHLGPLKIPRALVPFPAASGTNQDLQEAREQRQQREEIDRQEVDRERRRALEESNAAARQRRESEQSGGADPDG